MNTIDVRGTSVPQIGLGTWALRGETCHKTVLMALDLGYRHIDTAEMYDNERAIGRAIAQSRVPREELFLTSKVWRDHMHHGDVIKACDRSLEDLGADYLDLYLIHWPVADVPIDETVGALDELQHSGRARRIGVSNFSAAQLAEAQEASQAGIFCNQVEINPWRHPGDLLAACQASDVLMTAYTPLARGRVQSSDVLREIGATHGKTPVQVALRWLIQKPNVVAIPKASSREHLEQNLAVFDFELDNAAMEAIDDLSR